MLDERQLTYTSYNGQNLNSPAVSVITGSTVLSSHLYLGISNGGFPTKTLHAPLLSPMPTVHNNRISALALSATGEVVSLQLQGQAHLDPMQQTLLLA
jgi:hypothetical protein